MARASTNNVRGPTSALTEFLRESGITRASVARRAATQNQQPQESVAGPSNSGNIGVSPDNNLNVEGNTGSTSRRARSNATPGDYASDELDESDESSAPLRKRRKTKASNAKQKGKPKKKEDDEDNDQEEDTYTALSRTLRSQSSSKRPPIGSFEDCAKCETRFTVSKYTISANPGPGFLCHHCAKAAGNDPFKKPATQKKRKMPADKRQIPHLEERFPSLVSTCIQLITKHIDDVEALGDIGAVNLEAIAKALAKNRSLTPENAHLFYGVQNTSLILYDCTKLTSSAFQTLPMLNPSLVMLRLDFCGQLDTDTFKAMSTSLPHLERLELLGPFLVRSEAWIAFFKNHLRLKGFLITQCPRFGLECIKSLTSECQSLTELGLKEMKVDDGWLKEISAIGTLKCLDLSSPETSCSEEALVQLLRDIGPGLEALDLSKHESITDGFLDDGLSKWTGSLEKLSLQECPEITDRAVSRLFDTWIGSGHSASQGVDTRHEASLDGALNDVDGPIRSWNKMGRRRPTQQRRGRGRASVNNADASPCQNGPLAVVDLARNRLLGSRSLLSIIRHSGTRLKSLNINGWKEVATESLQEVGNYAQELKKVDVGWCRNMDDSVLAGWVGINIPIEGSDRTTKGRCLKMIEVKVWGCNRVTGKFPMRRGVIIHGIESQTSG
ncbi:RNI-like protein [Amanita muscaria]